MKITIESTAEVTTIDGATVRKWVGATDGQIPVTLFIARIAVRREHEADFKREFEATGKAALIDQGVGDFESGQALRAAAHKAWLTRRADADAIAELPERPAEVFDPRMLS